MILFEYNANTGDLSTDFRDTEDAGRKFYVDVRDKVVAEQLVAAQFGGKNSPYPGKPGLLVDRVEVTDSPDGIGCDVRYIYTNDRSGGSSFRYRKQPGFLGYRESTVTGRMPAPGAYFTRVVVPTTIAQVNLIVNQWNPILPIATVPVVQSRHEIEVVVKGWGSAQSKAIASQVNKIHLIQGRSMVFEGGSVTQQIPSDKPTTIEYNVRYAWLSDDGTPKYDPESYDSTSIRLPTIDRPPFTEWVLRPGNFTGPLPASETDFDKFLMYTTKPLYQREDQGWRNLPGVPEL